MVTQVAIDKRTGHAMGVHHVSGGREHFQRAAMVAIAGYSIETPRLLLNSASSRFTDGLCNSIDQVGRYLMVQGAPQTAGRFDAEVRMYKAPPAPTSKKSTCSASPRPGRSSPASPAKPLPSARGLLPPNPPASPAHTSWQLTGCFDTW
jgi:choline dehydrogenase-like flavoprotein